MSFVGGLEKTATLNPFRWAGRAISAPAALAARGVRRLGGGFRRGLEEGAQAGATAGRGLGKHYEARATEALRRREATSGVPRSHEMLKAKAEELAGKGQARVLERARTMREKGTLRRMRPSFAQRHPIATGVGAYLGAKQVFGGGQQEERRPQAQVVYPQGY